MKSRSDSVDSVESLWLSEARAGNGEAFGNLVQAYQAPVYNLCYRMLGDSALAEDAAQEAFLRAFRHLGRYDPQRSFLTWLLSIASHYCIDRLRRRSLVTVPAESEAVEMEMVDPMPGPEGMLARREQREAVHRMLGRLGAQDRAVIVLRYWYDMSYEEMADTLSVTVSAVKTRLHRARQSMAEHWLEAKAAVFTVQERNHEPSTL